MTIIAMESDRLSESCGKLFRQSFMIENDNQLDFITESMSSNGAFIMTKFLSSYAKSLPVDQIISEERLDTMHRN